MKVDNVKSQMRKGMLESGAGTYPGRGTGHRLSQHEGDGEKMGERTF